MLKNLTQGLSHIIKKVRGQGRLSEENIKDAITEIRTVLLDADTALSVVDEFLDTLRQNVIGSKIDTSLNPGKAFIAIVQSQLTLLMGAENSSLRLKKSPAVVMACGVQGVGKTTNLAKIAKRLKEKDKRRVFMASVDVRRPAALEQLQILADSIGVSCLNSDKTSSALDRARLILPAAGRELADVVLVDTAGRTAIDAELMDEMRDLEKLLNPSEILFFVDAMQGQDALVGATEFNAAVPISGIVATKFDGDSRGGAILSAKAVTGCPIKFVGVGEKLDDLQLFHPTRFVSRLLGMGDIAGLAETLHEKIDVGAMQRLEKKIKKRDNFDLEDYLGQLQQMQKMGGMAGILDKMPSAIADKLGAAANDDKPIKMAQVIILSMTPTERRNAQIIKASRKRRIAAGSGVSVQDINRLLKQHEQAQKMMKKFSHNPAGLSRMMKGILG